MNNLGDYVYYALVYNYLQTEIEQFQQNVLGNAMTLVSTSALVLVTLWITIQGYRIMTGQSREPLMALVVQAGRVALIVMTASTMSVFSQPLQTMLSANGDGNLGAAISALVSGETSPVAQIDRNMAATQLTLSAIDVVQVPPGDTENAQAKAHATMLAGFGAASPPMAAGSMLLLYQFAVALFIGLGPIFILCLVFEQTKELFRKWLFYGIGTLFSIATLCVVSSMALKLTENVAAALWAADLINNFTGQGAEGISSRALEQGGIGLMLTVLIISVPPMAAMFFQGLMGSFMHFSGFGGGSGGGLANRPGPQGQPVGSYGSGSAPSRIAQANSASSISSGGTNQFSGPRAPVSPAQDKVKPFDSNNNTQPGGRP